MTPEIKLIDDEIRALKQRREVLLQANMAINAVAQIGELITWGRQSRKGRVLFFEVWLDKVSYRVRLIKKDGTEGSVFSVYSYDKPVRFEV